MDGIKEMIGRNPREDNPSPFRYYARMKITSLLLGLLFAAGSIMAVGSQHLTLSAPSSLTDVVLKIQNDAQRFVGAQIFLSFSASGTLRRQIEQGSPVDLFISASRDDMDKLQREGLIVIGSRHDLLQNSLVMISDPSARAAEPGDLKKLVSSASVVALGSPDAVPSGQYAVEALKKYGLYEVARTKLAFGGSVREVLQLVQSGKAPVGFVFLTDVLSAQPPGSIVHIFRFPAETFSTPIVYPVAVTASSKNKVLAEKLLEFLRSDAARSVFLKAGFEIP
jgi:molybdate transport system substrate-binding protein